MRDKFLNKRNSVSRRFSTRLQRDNFRFLPPRARFEERKFANEFPPRFFSLPRDEGRRTGRYATKGGRVLRNFDASFDASDIGSVESWRNFGRENERSGDGTMGQWTGRVNSANAFGVNSAILKQRKVRGGGRGQGGGEGRISREEKWQ